MSEQSFIDFIMNKLNNNELFELPLNAVCNDVFEGKPASEHEIAMRLMSFRQTYSIDYVIAMNPGMPPTIRFWKINEVIAIPEPEQIITQEGEELCPILQKIEEISSTAQ